MRSRKVFEAEFPGRFHIASVSERGLAVHFCAQERKLISHLDDKPLPDKCRSAIHLIS